MALTDVWIYLSNLITRMKKKKDKPSRIHVVTNLSKFLVEKKPNTLRIKFTYPMPSFYGSDDKVYGPYRKGQVAEVDKKVARLLIRKNRAEEMT